jgi:KaiC/GvpD/RAD55 family RecA-like ATPase
MAGAMVVELLLADGEGHHQSEHLVAMLQASGPVVLVTVDRPEAVLRPALEKAGTDTSRLTIIDTVSAVDGRPTASRPGVLYVPSPTMLELLAMRIEQAAVRLGPQTRVVIDSLSALALYNGSSAVHSFIHYLANRLRANRMSGHFIVHDTPSSQRLRTMVGSVTDAVRPLRSVLP